MNNISTDYFCHRIEPFYQNQANLLLATTGVLNALSGNFKLFITSIDMENIDKLSFDNIQRFTMLVTVLNKDGIKVNTIKSFGSPNQCYQYTVYEFSCFLQKHNDEIYLLQHSEPSYEELINGESKMSELQEIQAQVDDWINSVGVRYFSELTNMSNLTEEVGEVARLIGREYGEQSFKPNEKPDCIKTAIADELSDVLFVVVCLANQLDIDLGAAFNKNMNKKTKRDKSRTFKTTNLSD